MRISWILAKTILKKNIKSPLVNVPLILFPIVELLLFGYMNKTSGFNNDVQNPFIFGTMLWVAIYRSQIEISSTVFEDISSSNLKNIFSAPVSVNQYINGVIISSFIKLLPALLVFFLISQLLFNSSPLQEGASTFFSLVNFIIFGWIIGIITSGLALVFGSKVNFLSWFSAVILYPFLSTYYQSSAMGWPLNIIGQFMPTSQITTSLLIHNTISFQDFSISLLWNVFYFLLANLFLQLSFKIALKRGVFYYQ